MAKDEENEKKDKQEASKIIVDDDWKAQAQAEKEKLAEATEKPGGPQPGPREIPPASFVTLVNSLAVQTMLALGGVEDPRTKKRMVDLDLAKHHIDTLAVIEEKTSGNLTDDEKKLLDKTIYETRMVYVQMAQRVSGGAG